MYQFRDLELARSPTTETRSADALNYDGHWLDDEIAEFKTLTVSGRDDFSRSINMAELSSDGAQYLSSRFTDKKLEVKFFLNCESGGQYESAVSKIKRILYPPEKKIKFNDEQNYYYIGTVDSFVLDNPLYSTTGKISFTVSNPYKLSEIKKIEGTGTTITIYDNELQYPNLPSTLKFIPTAGGANISINNAKQHKSISAKVAYSSGNEIVFDLKKLEFYINKVSHLMDIDLSSNIGDFYIADGDTITTNITGKYELDYEVKRL